MTRSHTRRIGLVADTHDNFVDWEAVHGPLAAALDGVDLILHCGDLGTSAVLGRLAELAPVLAVRSSADPPAAPPALTDGPRVVEAGGLSIGLTFCLGDPPVGADLEDGLRFTTLPPDRVGPELFGRPVDVVVSGGTHRPVVAWAGGVLFVNPGSPSLADPTTVGRLDVVNGVAEARIVPLGQP